MRNDRSFRVILRKVLVEGVGATDCSQSLDCDHENRESVTLRDPVIKLTRRSHWRAVSDR